MPFDNEEWVHILHNLQLWVRKYRHLTWNKNYNVKPREISEAQDRFTCLLQKIYLNQPSDREIVRLIMACVGRGGSGDVGQRIRDEILLIQRNYDCGTGMMEEWHQKLHNNSSHDDIIICEEKFYGAQTKNLSRASVENKVVKDVTEVVGRSHYNCIKTEVVGRSQYNPIIFRTHV
ncbi:hypothetical protein K1719_028010 [Acacia pycnantha]|nr:hypothetical protein K1719_028010 [Acacia pycnantha]